MRLSPKRRGLAAIELAILLPLLLLLVVGLWEVGRMVEVQQVLANAAREGARQASTGVRSSTEVKDVVVRYLIQNGISGVTSKNVTVTNITSSARPEPNACEQLDQFKIAVTIPFSSVRWAVLDQLTSIQTLTGTTDWYSMRDIPITVDTAIPLQ